jgi:hypothetical protein
MTHDEVLKTFVYEPDTGLLRRVLGGRKPYPWRKIGKNGRYLACTVNGENVYLHRAVFLYHHGYMPDFIDHVDRDTTNNRVSNLRPATNAQNQYNSPRKVNNRSGAKGVVFHPKCVRKPWQAKIVVSGKVVSLGYYKTVEEASSAYESGAKKHAINFAFKGQ